MNSFIERLFTQRASRLTGELVEDPKRIFFQYLFDLGINSNRLKLIESQIENFHFPEDSYIADLCIVSFYLDLENYLIHYDNRYSNTVEKLRIEVKEKFPKITTLSTFLPIYESGKNQEIVLSKVFLLTILKKFKDEDLELANTTAWIQYIEASLKVDSSNDLVKQINAFRKIKDDSFKINKEFGSIFGQDFVDSVFAATKDEFFNYYRHLTSVLSIADIVPHLFTSLLNESSPVISFEQPFENREDNNQTNVKSAEDFQIQSNSILENLLDGYILFGTTGIIKDCNTLASKIFGYTGNELIKRSIYDFFPDDLATQIKSDLTNLNTQTESLVIGKCVEADLTNRAGNTLAYEISFSNNFSSPDESFTLLIKDISHRKDTLKAKLNAERVAEAKTTFLSNMSHEIRTPLNVILGLSEIISKSDLQDHNLLKKNIDGISFSAKNLLSIVNDILDFSKIEAGKLTLQSLDFNLREFVTNLTSGFEIKGKEKGLKFITVIDPAIPNIVVGDQFRLNQILTNLIGNSIKFTKKGQVEIELHLLDSNEDFTSIEFKVKDTGIGIPKDQLESIFESFYQVEEKDNAKINGTGLGLTITRELINLQNGSLKAQSEPGKGSTFSFDINFKKSNLTKINKRDSSTRTNNSILTGLRILVAEDNKMNQFYIRQLLQGLGVKADIAENGEEAVAMYKNNPVNYDLILMDMHMPVMNGLEAISLIRQSNKDTLRKVPIVACTADVFPEARKNAIKAGIDFYLTKPLKEEDIKEVLYWLISDDESKNKPVETNAELQPSETKSGFVDIANLFEIFDNDKEFIISLLEVFITETPEDLNSLRNCVARGYYPRASTLAHKMKSSFMNLGMTTHGHHLQQIESSITNPLKNDEALKHLKAFEDIYTKSLIEINMLIIDLKQNH